MLIIRKGIDTFTADERQFRHHRLEELASLVPDLSKKDRAILRLLTDFVMWAGRYPDPGSGRETAAETIFTTSEEHHIAAGDVFDLARRVMQRAAVEIERSNSAPGAS